MTSCLFQYAGISSNEHRFWGVRDHDLRGGGIAVVAVHGISNLIAP